MRLHYYSVIKILYNGHLSIINLIIWMLYEVFSFYGVSNKIPASIHQVSGHQAIIVIHLRGFKGGIGIDVYFRELTAVHANRMQSVIFFLFLSFNGKCLQERYLGTIHAESTGCNLSFLFYLSLSFIRVTMLAGMWLLYASPQTFKNVKDCCSDY